MTNRRRVAALAVLVAAGATSLATATPAQAAGFDCSKVVIDRADSLNPSEEDDINRWGGFYAFNGVEIHIIIAPNLEDDGTPVRPGASGGGPGVGDEALTNYVLTLKDNCQDWSTVDVATGSLVAKDDLVIIAVAPANAQATVMQGAGTQPIDSEQSHTVLVQGIIAGYESGDPASGYNAALWSLAEILFIRKWQVIGVMAIAGVIVIVVLARPAIKRRARRS